MKITRRDFLKQSISVGGTLFFPPVSFGATHSKSMDREPAYVKLDRTGELQERIDRAYAHFDECSLCPRQCGVDRSNGELGYCHAPAKVMIYSANPHFGEEKSLVGRGGSGTIFFSNCNLRCVFCQNWPIAIEGHGKAISDEDLADVMLRLQRIGCQNINLVTPTHVMPNILNATRIASRKGLRIPLVYNTSGYERVEMIKLLDGIVDIYLPDMKYMDADHAARYSSGAADYPEYTCAAVLEMHRQVGLHQMDERNIAVRGLMIRHLVMPNRVAGTRKFVQWVSTNLPKTTYLNIMHQYHVEYKAFEYPKIWRAITEKEYLEAMQWADEFELVNLDPDSLKIKNFIIRQSKRS